MAPKTKQETLWSQCDKCDSYILSKDIKYHASDCPINLDSVTYNFVRNDTLYGTIDIKTNVDIKNISTHDRDNMVFLSQSVMQLLNLSIGDWVVISDLRNEMYPIARLVWPTIEKSSTSVLLTKNSMDMTSLKANSIVCLTALKDVPLEAYQVRVILSNSSKNLDISSELQNRFHKLYSNKYISVGNKITIMFYGKLLVFEIKFVQSVNDKFGVKHNEINSIEEKLSELSTKTNNKFYKLTEKTNWTIFRNHQEYKKVDEVIDPVHKIGGLDNEIDEIEQLINMALNKNENFKNVPMCRAVLIYGSSGTGKSLILDAFKKSSMSNVFTLSSTDLFTNQNDNTFAEILQNLFENAIRSAPSLIIIDDVDILCPNRISRINDTDKKIVSSLLKMFDKLNELESNKVFILAATNKLDSIDPAFRRCGRFDREIEIPTPNSKARYAILKKLLIGTIHSTHEDALKEISDVAHGFVGADLVSLCSRASLHAYQCNQKILSVEHFKSALKNVKPSAMREVQIEMPNVHWADIGGLENLKLILRQCVEWPLKHADCFVRLGITPPKGVLMFGPPGCSKTMVAKALATESGLNFLSIKGPELFSKWVGESERAVREVFRKARHVAPSIIFFDEIDALGGERSSGSTTSVQERVLAQLLTELDGISPLSDVTILAATNRPDRIDKALLRPGRLDRIIYMPLPDEKTRLEIFKIKTKKMPTIDIDLEELVARTKGYSGAEVNAVCHEAALKALEEDINIAKISMTHFKMALELVTPRTPESLLKIYETYISN